MSGWYGSPVVAVELGQVRPAAAITTSANTTIFSNKDLTKTKHMENKRHS